MCFGPPHFEEKTPIQLARIHIQPYVLYSTLDSFLPSSSSPLLPFLLSLHTPIFPSTILLRRLQAWYSCSLLSLYISLFLCPQDGIIQCHHLSRSQTRQPHRTAPCETKAALVESVAISLVRIPLTTAFVISSPSITTKR